jgi:hypothetical protein
MPGAARYLIDQPRRIHPSAGYLVLATRRFVGIPGCGSENHAVRLRTAFRDVTEDVGGTTPWPEMEIGH